MQRMSIYQAGYGTPARYGTPTGYVTPVPAGKESLARTLLRKLKIGKRHKPCTADTCPHFDARYDSLRPMECGEPAEEEELLKAPWYQSGIPREIALDLLNQQEIGSFIVRDSTSHKGCFALSVKVPKFDNPVGISHYLIGRTLNGHYRLKGVDKEWPSLTALVVHHTVMPEMLPCTLRLPRSSNNPTYRASEQDMGGDYQRLADFSLMMAELKM